MLCFGVRRAKVNHHEYNTGSESPQGHITFIEHNNSTVAYLKKVNRNFESSSS